MLAKRCYINARFLTQSTTGVQRTATELVKALDEIIEITPGLADQIRFTMLVPHNFKHDLKLRNIPVRVVGRLTGHAWEQFELPWYSRNGILVSLCNTGPLVKRQQMVLIYDASPFVVPETYSRAFRTWYRFLYPVLGWRARRIITISEFSRSELIKYAGIAAEKISVTGLGADHVLAVVPDYSVLSKLKYPWRPFLLAVSSRSPNKNFPMLADACSKVSNDEFQLVVAGGNNKRIFQQQEIKECDNLQFLGYISDQQLRALYEKAHGFVYPSLYEGFGLPPVEAMTCGCPVILSDIPPHREICEDAAIYCDPKRSESIAEQMSLLLENRSLREELTEKGRKQAVQYTWALATQKFIGDLCLVIGMTESGLVTEVSAVSTSGTGIVSDEKEFNT